MPGAEKHKVQFGSYQLDTQCGELRKNGVGLKLRGQPVQILEVLLEKPGQLVSRDELRQRLWASDTFVDFDHGLNVAIKKLRQALGDDADTPCYIETLPKRGYRFIARVSCDTSQPKDMTSSRVVELEDHSDGDRSGITDSIPAGAASSKGDLPDVPDDRECAIPGESQTRRSRGSTYVVAFLAGITLFSVVLLMLRARQDVRPVKIVQFTSLPGFETRPSFSPDGTQIDFAATGESEGVDIYVKAIGDEKVLRLTEEPISRRPQWSPDGRTIAYDHWNKVGHAIFLMTPLGGAKHKIRELAEGSDGFTSWSPDSKLLAYDDKPAGESSGFFLMPTAGLPARRLTLAPAGTFDSAPAFSPDGKQIAFVRSSDEGGAAELRVVSLNNLDESRLATLDRMAGPVAWTPDSKRIIFCASGFFAGESDLFAVPASGGKPERLQIISSDAGWPAISPRGDKLAYTTAFFDTNIWKLSLRDSSPPTKLIASTRMEMQPTYSPDGRRVAYVSNRDGTLAIWVCNDDGTDQTRLVSVASGGGTPVWSPDGKQIAFDSNEGGRWNILLMDADGSNQVGLTDDGSDHRGPSWSADGEWIYFGCNRSGTWEIWKISVRTRRSVQVTSHGGAWAQESPDGKFVYYLKPKIATRHDFQMPSVIWRMPNAGGAEEVVWRGADPHPNEAWFWKVTGKGIYLLDDAAKPKPALKFLDLRTRAVQTIRELDKQLWGGPGLGISPDERTVLISQIEAAGSDIMIVENFR